MRQHCHDIYNCSSTLINIFAQIDADSHHTHPHMQNHHKSFTSSIRETFLEETLLHQSSIAILLEVNIWHKDNQGLFDYQAETNALSKERILIRSSGKIYRHPKSAKPAFIPEESEQEPAMESIYIASVVLDKQNKQCYIQSADVSGVQPHPFICQEQPEYFRNSYVAVADLFKDPDEKGYPLQVGNFLRLGKVQFMVIEVKDAQGTRVMKESSHLSNNRGVYVVDSGRQAKGACKFCLCEESTASDPLVAPCQCRGSCREVHVECLRSWINSKVRREVADQVHTFNFSKFECEICKALFPKAVLLPNRTLITMLDYHKPSTPYIILESCPDTSPVDRVVHVLSPSVDMPVKLGRNHNCAIKVDDITVSRFHAEVRFAKGKFYVTDLNSKFGTLVKFREEFMLRDRLKLQSGRSTYTFSYLKHTSNPSYYRKDHKDRKGICSPRRKETQRLRRARLSDE